MKLWIENPVDGVGGWAVHLAEPQLKKDGSWGNSRGWWWIGDVLAKAILGKNLPRPGQVAEVNCAFKTFWE